MNEFKTNSASELLEKFFGDAYLFDQANAFFREKVSPKNTAGLETPPAITCDSFLRYANCTVDETNINFLREAAASSFIVEAVRNENGEWCLRRRFFLDPQNDPAFRSVVVLNLHCASTPEEVAEFFQPYGNVECARVLLQPHKGAPQRTSFVVRFSKVEEAVACANARISFGKAASPLAQHFIPSRVNVVLLEKYRANAEGRDRESGQAQLLQNVVSAQKALAELNDDGIKRFVRRGVTLKVEGLPPGTTWQTVKMKLGNLGATNPVLRRGITLSKVEGPDATSPSRPWRAFVVCRSEEIAKEMRTSFNLADGDFGRELRLVCPTLLPLSDAEEDYVRHNFPEWCRRRVEAKRVENLKRLRKY